MKSALLYFALSLWSSSALVIPKGSGSSTGNRNCKAFVQPKIDSRTNSVALSVVEGLDISAVPAVLFGAAAVVGSMHLNTKDNEEVSNTAQALTVEPPVKSKEEVVEEVVEEVAEEVIEEVVEEAKEDPVVASVSVAVEEIKKEEKEAEPTAPIEEVKVETPIISKGQELKYKRPAAVAPIEDVDPALVSAVNGDAIVSEENTKKTPFGVKVLAKSVMPWKKFSNI